MFALISPPEEVPKYCDKNTLVLSFIKRKRSLSLRKSMLVSVIKRIKYCHGEFGLEDININICV